MTPVTPSRALVRLEPNDHPQVRPLFQGFKVFTNYIHYAFKYLEPEIWVDDPAKTGLAFLYTPPAYFLYGDPDQVDASPVFEKLADDSYLVPSSDKWDRHLNAFFSTRLETYPRTSFDSASLDREHLRSLKTELPPGLRLVPIGPEHIQDTEGMLYQDLLKRFFSHADFLQCGAGFCLMEESKIIGFAASNYPIHDKVLEVYIRVDFDYDPAHRHKGFGTLLSVALLEYCLEKGLDPQWDAANDISVRLALKLGYTRHLDWKMYHLTPAA